MNRQAVKPNKVNGIFMVTRTAYYQQQLSKLVKGIFEIECPDDWDKDYIRDSIIRYGKLAVTDTDFGVLPLQCATQGYNYYNNPTNIIISVPTIEGLHRTIGADCELLYLEYINSRRLFYNFNEAIRIYAEKLASCDASIDVNLMNSRVAYIAEAETRAQAESIKLAYDKVSAGEPLVVYRKDVVAPGAKGLDVFFNNIKQNFIADVLQDSKRTIMNEFLTSIGLNNANTDKKERLVTDEVAANNVELMANTTVWDENLERCCEKINSMFGIDFSMKLKFNQLNCEEVSPDDIDRQHQSMENSEQQ